MKSLANGGFPAKDITLFVDGCKDSQSYEREFKCGVVSRSTPVHSTHTEGRGPAGNWILSMHELYLREPYADRFIMFQDDLLCYKNLRTYLEISTKGVKGHYWNLYTHPPPRQSAPPDKSRHGWFESNQMGRGAVGLMFDRQGVMQLLSCYRFTERSLDLHRGHRNVDGGILETMKKANFKELVHHPSLTQHIGTVSSFGNKPQAQALHWMGEDHDACKFIIPSEPYSLSS
jgi:hypothetical protein